jgi:lysophospholipid acyltransferase (LPLAT)-like uncharacterized protein
MKRFFKLNILPFLLYVLVRIIYFTNKKVYHHPQEDNGDAFLVCMWHGDLMSQPYNYYGFRKNGNVKAMISHNKDGEIIAKLVSSFKIGALRGSSSKGAAKVLISAIKELKSGNDVAITPDGPRGPRYSVADGVVAIAQKSKVKIRCFNAIPTKYWQFGSWDKFVLPKPFGRIDFYVSEPYDLSSMEFEEAREFVKEKMMIHSLV